MYAELRLNRLHCREHPLDVLSYAMKRNLTDVIDEAVPRTIGLEIEAVITVLGKDTFVPWVRNLKLVCQSGDRHKHTLRYSTVSSG